MMRVAKAEDVKRYEQIPGNIVATKHADGYTFDWIGGKIAGMDVLFFMELGLDRLPWVVTVLGLHGCDRTKSKTILIRKDARKEL